MIDRFMSQGCGCKQNCPSRLGREAIEQRRNNCTELSKPEKDMAILGQLAALDHCTSTAGGLHRKDVDRKRARANFSVRVPEYAEILFCFYM